MTWSKIFESDLLPEQWYVSSVINSGSYFKVINKLSQFEFRGRLAQIEIDIDGTYKIYQQELLRIRNTEEIYKFTKPSFFTDRRIGIYIANVNFIPIESWECSIEIYYSVESEVIEGDKNVELSQVRLNPGEMTPLLSSNANRKGHVVENLGSSACVVYYSLSSSFELYSVLLEVGEKYSWDYPDVYPYKAYSVLGTTVKLFDIY